MPHVTETFVSEVVATVRERGPAPHAPPSSILDRLHEELSAVGLPVTGEEGRFGPEAGASLKRFQERYGLPVSGNLDPTTGGVLSLAAIVASEEDRSRLRARLAEARGAMPGSAEYNEWLARFALVAGDYNLAGTLGVPLKDRFGRDLGAIISEGLGNWPPRAPEIPFPENFYCYRYSLIAQEGIDELRRGRTRGVSGELPFFAAASRRPVDDATGSHPPPFDLPSLAPVVSPSEAREDRIADSAEAWLAAIEAWQLGNREFTQRRYRSAAAAYDRCQQATLWYFALNPDYAFIFTTATLSEQMDELLWLLAGRTHWPALWESFTWRRQLLSLAELGQTDWTDPFGPPPVMPRSVVYEWLRANLSGSEALPGHPEYDPANRITLIDFHLIIIACSLAPLARGEANRECRKYAAANFDFARLLRRQIPNPTIESRLPLTVGLLCEFIEIPFVRLLMIETLIDQAECEYKARTRVDDIKDETERAAALAKLDAIKQDFEARHIAGDLTPGAKPLQNLIAAITCAEALSVIQADGDYLSRAKHALDVLSSVTSLSDLTTAGHAITLPTVVASDVASKTGAHPHEPLVTFVPPNGTTTMRECNPRVYGLLLRAQARLLQIWCGFNYLGYRDDYTPPWRFAFLLERARFFVEHAKNAQRDYLNFLSNAEAEELKELSAAQNVELEKVNVQMETARVEQASREVDSAWASVQLAQLNARDAQARRDDYASFSDLCAVVDFAQYAGTLVAAVFGGAGPADVGHTIVGGVESQKQRDIELFSLTYAIDEAKQAQRVAGAQLEVAKSGLIVAGLARQAALLRHAHALQNLQFTRNRTLNAEQWTRLASAIRSVADTYLRYAIELSFLAQQAYNFESDRRLKIIRFDYDLSDVGAMLAADFLQRDLDTLEQDHIVTQSTRLQQVRYVVSLAREYPEALRSLAEDGSVTFSIRLEQLERHFPGLLGLRISSVDLQPIALMDPTRVSVELTHLGFGMIRLKQQPSSSSLDSTDVDAAHDWLGTGSAGWPIKVHVCGPETAVFTGLSHQEIASASTTTANERGAFEAFPAASSWRISLSVRENQLVPGTLADVLVTLVLGGTYDANFANIVATAAAASKPRAITSLISTRRSFPDSYYSLVRYGRMNVPISERNLSLSGPPQQLRNLSVAVPLTDDGPELGRCYCRYPLTIDVSAGAVQVSTAAPQLTFTSNGLSLRCQYAPPAVGPTASTITWDFGDGAALQTGLDVQHLYVRAGRYDVTARLIYQNELFEYRCAVVVSAQHALTPPLAVAPSISAGAIDADGLIPVTVSLPAGITGLSLDCSAGAVRAFSDAGSAVLSLAPGSHVLHFMAMRSLSTHFYGKQRYLPTDPVLLNRGRNATNRTFVDETETTTSPNAFSTHVFGGQVLSPVDRWTLEIPLSTNPWFGSVSSSDILEIDCSELADGVLVFEFVGAQ